MLVDVRWHLCWDAMSSHHPPHLGAGIHDLTSGWPRLCANQLQIWSVEKEAYTALRTGPRYHDVLQFGLRAIT